MNISYVTDSLILYVTAVLCFLLLLKILYNIRSTLSWRVNCWFCNSNSWVKFTERNCWTCQKCEQYNGFTKDGDYNKMLIVHEEKLDRSFKPYLRSPPKNGFCKMCNINQQLKVTQLANFVPMNDKKYDEEIECYRSKLEKAYKLCSPCRKVLQFKLHKEKEKLLGSKLLESRTTEKINTKKEKQIQIIKNTINKSSMFVAGLLLIFITMECYESMTKRKSLSDAMKHVREICTSLIKRVFYVMKMEILSIFPSMSSFFDIYSTLNVTKFTNFVLEINGLIQKILGCFVCFIQVIGHFWTINKAKYAILVDFLWIIFIMTTVIDKSLAIDPLIVGIAKLSIIISVMVIYRSMKVKIGKSVTRRHITPKKMTKHNIYPLTSKYTDNEDNISSDTDDDVSLSKFGLHNLTDTSNETSSTTNNSMGNGRTFTPRTDLWSKPKHNSTFCVSSSMEGNLNARPGSVFIKPSFKKCQQYKDDSDSELDESISSLCISSPKKRSGKTNPVFELRKFTASPNFVAPSPMLRSRPLISPSKLGHGTSWVAGGYWGTEGDRHMFSNFGSRSSSQSSGFESQASSVNQRNVFSQPHSREESECRDSAKPSILLDGFQNFNMSNYNNFHTPSTGSFAPINSPVFPQMQYNNHVQIPHPGFAQQTFVSQNVFSQQYMPNRLFKAPGGSRLIKLPQDGSFAAR